MRNQGGFGYLAILLVVAISSVALAGVGVLWSTERKRENEQQLLVIGQEIHRAIALYYQNTPGMVKRYPRTLDDLLKDDRFVMPQRYLRQIYVDPMTGTRKWGLITAPEGGVMGVHSLLQQAPLKQTGFPAALASFEGKSSYREWQFIYRPTVINLR